MSGRESKQGSRFEGHVRDVLLVEFLGAMLTRLPIPDLQDRFDPIEQLREQERSRDARTGVTHDVDLLATTKSGARLWFACKSGIAKAGSADTKSELARFFADWKERTRSGTTRPGDRYLLVVANLTESWASYRNALENHAKGDPEAWEKLSKWVDGIAEDPAASRDLPNFAKSLRILHVPRSDDHVLQRIEVLALARREVKPKTLLDAIAARVKRSAGAFPPIELDSLRRSLARDRLVSDLAIEQGRFVETIRAFSTSDRPERGLASDHPEWVIARIRELDELEAHAREGHVVLYGPSGAGKSWLVDRWRERLGSEGRSEEVVMIDASRFVFDQDREPWSGSIREKLDWLARAGVRFVIVDGLDEVGVPESPAAKIAEHLLRELHRRRDLRVVAVGRVAAIRGLDSPHLEAAKRLEVPPLATSEVTNFARTHPEACIVDLRDPNHAELLRVASRPFLLARLIQILREPANEVQPLTTPTGDRDIPPEALLQWFWTWLASRIGESAVSLAAAVARRMIETESRRMSLSDPILAQASAKVELLVHHDVLRKDQDFVRFTNAAHLEFAYGIACVRGGSLADDLSKPTTSLDPLTRIGVVRAIVTRVLSSAAVDRDRDLPASHRVPPGRVTEVAQALARAATIDTIPFIVDSMLGLEEPGRSRWLAEFTHARAALIEKGSVDFDANCRLLDRLAEITESDASIPSDAIASLLHRLLHSKIDPDRFARLRDALEKSVDRIWTPSGPYISAWARRIFAHAYALACASDESTVATFSDRVRSDADAAWGLLDAADSLTASAPKLAALLLAKIAATLGTANASTWAWQFEMTALGAFHADPIRVTEAVIDFFIAAGSDPSESEMFFLAEHLQGAWTHRLKDDDGNSKGTELIELLERRVTTSVSWRDLLFELVDALNRSVLASRLHASPALRPVIDPATRSMNMKRIAAGSSRSVGWTPEIARAIDDRRYGIRETDLEMQTRADRESLRTGPQTRDPKVTEALRGRMWTVLHDAKRPEDEPLRVAIEEELAADVAADLEREEAPTPEVLAWCERVLPRFANSSHVRSRAHAARAIGTLSHFVAIEGTLAAAADRLAADPEESVLVWFAQRLPLAWKVAANTDWLWRHAKGLTRRALDENRHELQIVAIAEFRRISDRPDHRARWIEFLREFALRAIQVPRTRSGQNPRDVWIATLADSTICTADSGLAGILRESFERHDSLDLDSIVTTICEWLRPPAPGEIAPDAELLARATEWLRSSLDSVHSEGDPEAVAVVVRETARGLLRGARLDAATTRSLLELVARLAPSAIEPRKMICYGARNLARSSDAEFELALDLLESAFLRDSTFTLPADASSSGLLTAIGLTLEAIASVPGSPPNPRAVALLDAASAARVPGAADHLDSLRARTRD